MCSVVVYLHLDRSLYFALYPVFGDEEAAKGRRKSWPYNVKTFEEILC